MKVSQGGASDSVTDFSIKCLQNPLAPRTFPVWNIVAWILSRRAMDTIWAGYSACIIYEINKKETEKNH